ncbi:MAG: hypothetical protein LBO06_04270 [Bacteroidales bacterium]|jgi:hypothetical protein|nr:hypothetical protein [Bacteroidales bacterium]
MFYRIAIVQNEKELIQYDCADWHKYLDGEPLFVYYKCQFFNEHNIEDLFNDLSENIDKFDAVFFATNSLNSQIIYDACILDKNKNLIENFISKNHGLYVGYSSRIKERNFLPKNYLVKQEERPLRDKKTIIKPKQEDAKDGNLHFENHPATNAHFPIDKDKYVIAANKPQTVEGLYFDYLLYEDNSLQTLDPLVIDKEKNRVLMYCTKNTSGHRVIISTLPIDWQNQKCLFINVVKYCTEGVPTVEIIGKEKDTSNLFSRELLIRQLNFDKIAFVYREMNSLDTLDVENIYATTLIFDSSLEDGVIDSFYRNNKSKMVHRNLRILHYFEYSSGASSLYKLTVHSAFQEINSLEKKIILAIEDKTPDKKNKYRYDSNLLTTFEAIKFLQSNQIDNTVLYPLIVQEQKSRLQLDGSYDEMYMASCTFYAIWNLCSENVPFDDDHKKLESYIKNNSSNISIYEKAQFLHLVDNPNIISNQNKKVYIKEIICKIENVDGEELLSYGISNCWRILGDYFNTDFLEQQDSDKLFLLIKKSFSVFGNFKNNPKVSVVANYVYAISKMLKNKNIDDKSERAYIHKFLSSAIGYLYNSLDDSDSALWENDIYSSCLAITALKEFYALSVYPIDEILLLSNTTNKLGINIDNLLEISNSQTNSLISLKKNNTDLKSTNEELNENLKKLKLKNLGTKFSVVGGIIAIFILVVFIVPLLFDQTVLCSFFETVKSFYSKITGIVMGISAIVACVYTILNYHKKTKP